MIHSTREHRLMIEQKCNNRRRFPRFATKCDVFIIFRPLFAPVATLKDISKGGVGLEYYGEHDPSKAAEVDILCSSIHFYLSRVPCKVIYDIDLEKPTLIGIETRRCGLKFGKLSSQQTASLESILANREILRELLPPSRDAAGEFVYSEHDRQSFK